MTSLFMGCTTISSGVPPFDVAVKHLRPSSKRDNGLVITTPAFFASIRKRISTVEASPIAAIGLLGGSLWLFLTIAEAVMVGVTAAWDRRLLLALRNAADPALL